MSAVTDCYQPVENRLGITRQCLQVLAEFRNPVGVITKNHLVTRDLDILAGPQLYDVWPVNQDAEYHEAGVTGTQPAAGQAFSPARSAADGAGTGLIPA